MNGSLNGQAILQTTNVMTCYKGSVLHSITIDTLLYSVRENTTEFRWFEFSKYPGKLELLQTH